MMWLNSVHADGDSLVGLLGEGSKTHATRAEALHDALSALNLVERNGLTGVELKNVADLGAHELEGVSEGGGRSVLHRLLVEVVEIEVLGADGSVEGLD
jgi:hypothetical protein